MQRRSVIAGTIPWVAVFALLGCAQGPSGGPEPGGPAFELAAEVERVASVREYWPGFDPNSVPLAIYDGTQTYLFRHPAPPEGFSAVPGAVPAAHRFEGRHPKVVANSSAEIGGVGTATVMLVDPHPDRSLTNLAALALHEVFHVHQRAVYPAWMANEADAFVYPVENASLLGLRRRETEAFRRAFDARDPDDRACWARQALEARRARFTAMDAPFVAYERGNELNEGLATYVQYAAEGRVAPPLPLEGFPANNVRRRAYNTGAALALLLDQQDPEWRVAFDAADEQNLEGALAEALGDAGSGACKLSEVETATLQEAADRDVEGLLAARVKLREEFDAREGWRLVVEADPAGPLWVQGFDPINVSRVEGGVLHLRFLTLNNESGDVNVMDGVALTEAVGSHPLFNGVLRLIMTGLPEEPKVSEDGEVIRIEAPGITAELRGARLERTEGSIHVRLAAP